MPVSERTRRRGEVALATVGAVAVVVLVVGALLTAVPPSIANLTTSVSDGVVPEALHSGDLDAAVVVPEGWIVRREGDDVLVVVTPDGVLTARMTLTPDDPQTAVAASVDGSPRSEELASGLTVVHADADAGPAGVTAGVGIRGGSVLVVAEVEPGGDLPAYRPAIAQLLERVVP